MSENIQLLSGYRRGFLNGKQSKFSHKTGILKLLDIRSSKNKPIKTMVLNQPTYSEYRSALLVALIVLLSCWGLFYIDHETQRIADLFKIGNLIALAFYFIPAFFITFFIFVKIRQKKSQATSMLLASVIGIPLSFALVIGFFLAIH